MDEILQQILSELKEIKANQAVAERETRKNREALVELRLSSVTADQNQAIIEQGISRINDRLDAIEGRQAALSKDMIRHNHVVEPLLKIISENIDGMTERNRQVDRLEDKVEGHDNRIWALEQLATAK